MTQRIYDLETALRINSSPPPPMSCIIPAAGRGSRLGYHLPKILYPLLGKTILERLLERFTSFCTEIIVVVAPDSLNLVSENIPAKLKHKVFLTTQDKPEGMADAVHRAKDFASYENTLVVWGDQVLISNDTIAACVKAHLSKSNISLTMPTIIKESPYIHLERNPQGRIIKVLQKREGDLPYEKGENDCGLFLFKTKRLFSIIEDEINAPHNIGVKTKELNLLPLIPQLDNEEEIITCIRIQNEMEAMGINEKSQAELAEKYLMKQKVTPQRE